MATDHVIDIIIETSDRTGGGLDKVRDKLLRFDQSIQRTNERLQRMTNRAHEITMSLIDKVTPAGSGIQRWLMRMAGKAHQVTLSLNDRATSQIRATEARLFQMTAKAYTVTVNLKDRATKGLKNLGNNALMSATGFSMDMLAGAGIGYGIYDTVKTYKNFESQMSTVGAISGASAEQMQKLTEKAMEMGAKTSFSATEAGKAFEYMATAGWKTDQMMSGIEGIMNLAAASGEDLGSVSDIVTDSLTAFGLQASDAAHFSDVLAAAASNSNTNVGKMGYTFQYVAPIAGAMGQSIEDVAIATGLMANAGIKGEMAGTSLRFVMTNLAQDGGKAQKALKELGVEVMDSTGKMRPFMEIVKDARVAFDGLSDAEKSNKAYSIAGMNAMSGWLAMMNGAEEDLNKLEGAIRNADGTAKKMAETRLDNLAGDLTLLGSAWETLQLKMMQGSGSNFLREFVQGVRADVEKFTKYIEDGFDISDVGRIAMDVLTQLKNKFLEFDGIGSVLAGGVLIGGIAKITSKTIKMIDYLKEASTIGGAGGGIKGLPGGAGQGSVGVMNVRANVVNVGSGPAGPAGSGPMGGPMGGPTGGESGKPGSGKPSGPPKGVGKLGRFAKGAGILGAVLTVGSAAYDVYSTGQYNEQMTEDADKREQEALKNLSEKENTLKWAMSSSDVSEQDRITAQKEYEAARKEMFDSKVNQSQIEEDNIKRSHTATGGAIGSVVGTLVGGAIGSFVGGPVGTMVGGMAGAAIGNGIGEMIGANWTNITESASEAWESIKNGASGAVEWVGNKFSEIGSAVGEFFTPLTDAAITGINFMVGLFATIGECIGEAVAPVIDYVYENLWTPLMESVDEAIAYVDEMWAGVSDWFSENVWTPLGELASQAWDLFMTTATAAWDAVAAYFEPAASWFDTTVWQPISSAVDSVKSAITGAFESAWAAVTNLWGAAAGWFEANVIGPVRDKFNSIVQRGSEITGLRTSEQAEAFGGFVTSPRHILAGEDGGEVIIPLSSNKRARAIDLFEKTREILGGGIIGGFSGDEIFSGMDEMPGAIPIPVMNMTGEDGNVSIGQLPISQNARNAKAGDFHVEVGGVTFDVNINGGGSDGNDITNEVIGAIKENFEKLADDVAGHIAEKANAIFNNQPLTV